MALGLRAAAHPRRLIGAWVVTYEECGNATALPGALPATPSAGDGGNGGGTSPGDPPPPP